VRRIMDGLNGGEHRSLNIAICDRGWSQQGNVQVTRKQNAWRKRKHGDEGRWARTLRRELKLMASPES